jgi:anti-sigma factor RsiW
VDLNDELLCAYMDDELDAVQRERVSAALAADAGAQLRLQRMRDADRDLAAGRLAAGDDRGLCKRRLYHLLSLRP